MALYRTSPSTSFVLSQWSHVRCKCQAYPFTTVARVYSVLTVAGACICSACYCWRKARLVCYCMYGLPPPPLPPQISCMKPWCIYRGGGGGEAGRKERGREGGGGKGPRGRKEKGRGGRRDGGGGKREREGGREGVEGTGRGRKEREWEEGERNGGGGEGGGEEGEREGGGENRGRRAREGGKRGLGREGGGEGGIGLTNVQSVESSRAISVSS